MYPFDSQGKTENYRSCPSTLQRQRRAPCHDLTVTRDIFYKRHCPLTPSAAGGPAREGAAGAAPGAQGWFFTLIISVYFWLLRKIKKKMF